MFWINILASVTIAIALLALAPLVAWFYNDDRAGYFTSASAVTVLLMGLCLQHSALLNRQMKFRTLSMIDLATAAVAFLATALSAYLLRSYWAILVGTVVSLTLAAFLTWKASPFRPSLGISQSGVGDMVRFGRDLTGFNFLTFLSRNLDNV